MDNRLAGLERRISALESTAANRRRQRTERGQAEAARALRELRARHEWSDVAPALAALGSPIRLTLLREIVHGRTTVNALSQVDGLGTSGQIYHHLRHLTAEGWLHNPSRGVFAIPPSRIAALHAILNALTD
ncbi:ArsR family transcriptional regulator [Kribbella turkmenica]|uniref:ArsR family transcriptional regulator n=1 Tax=Kribbella turkmenica TaxID=2530375 RepID=A0A4R4WQ71_9ACTN|nr:ArsR family transcriptional regulator [Kribbella turkmenica]